MAVTTTAKTDIINASIKGIDPSWTDDAKCARGNWLNEREARELQVSNAKVCE